jgi:hypothetical protein
MAIRSPDERNSTNYETRCIGANDQRKSVPDLEKVSKINNGRRYSAEAGLDAVDCGDAGLDANSIRGINESLGGAFHKKAEDGFREPEQNIEDPCDDLEN